MKKEQPVKIVFRKKKQGGGHAAGSHGAWKIAYADFITAMMALFIVLWLIGKSTPVELQAIAEYFRMPIAGISGTKITDSESPIPGGGDDITKVDGEEQLSVVGAAPQDEKQRFTEVARRVFEMFKLDPRLKVLQKNLIVELTDLGLRIQIVADNNQPMFEVGSAKIRLEMQEILRAIAPIINTLPNKITISGHTDERQYLSGDRGYSNWELSADRANASRRELIAGGFAPRKVMRVIGLADTASLQNPKYSADANRRISILVLNKSAQKYIEDENSMSGTDLLKQSNEVFELQQEQHGQELKQQLQQRPSTQIDSQTIQPAAK